MAKSKLKWEQSLGDLFDTGGSFRIEQDGYGDSTRLIVRRKVIRQTAKAMAQCLADNFPEILKK